MPGIILSARSGGGTNRQPSFRTPFESPLHGRPIHALAASYCLTPAEILTSCWTTYAPFLFHDGPEHKEAIAARLEEFKSWKEMYKAGTRDEITLVAMLKKENEGKVEVSQKMADAERKARD